MKTGSHSWKVMKKRLSKGSVIWIGPQIGGDEGDVWICLTTNRYVLKCCLEFTNYLKTVLPLHICKFLRNIMPNLTNLFPPCPISTLNLYNFLLILCQESCLNNLYNTVLFFPGNFHFHWIHQFSAGINHHPSSISPKAVSNNAGVDNFGLGLLLQSRWPFEMESRNRMRVCVAHGYM